VVVSGEITVTFGEVEDAAAKVRSTSANIDMLLNDLRSMLRPLIADWTGAAAVNYQYQQHMWDAASEDLHSVLLRIAAVLETSHGSYVEAESELRSLWGNG
jgi:early secretory antigenic target protein ESAT-6